MARIETILFLIVGALISIGVATVFYLSVAPEAYQPLSKMRILTSLSDPIERGSALREDDIEAFTIHISADQSADDFAFMLNYTDTFKTALTGRTVTQTLMPGTFLEARFFAASPPEAFAQRIAPYNRAFSISVTGSASVMNFIVPGSRVDVFGTLSNPPGAPRADVLLEAVQVMAIDDITSLNDLEDGSLQTRSITVQAPPDVIETYLEKLERLEGSALVTLRGPVE